MILGLNKEELTIGFLYGLISCVVLGWFGLLTACLTAFLWALSGSSYRLNNKLFRRLGCPLAIVLPFFLTTHLWYNWLTLPIHFGILSVGYGIPDSTDKGSWLGRFWLLHWEGDSYTANIFTRGTVFIALAIGALPLLWRA